MSGGSAASFAPTALPQRSGFASKCGALPFGRAWCAISASTMLMSLRPSELLSADEWTIRVRKPTSTSCSAGLAPRVSTWRFTTFATAWFGE